MTKTSISWTAPELLSVENNRSGPSFPGDIYALSMVIFEVCNLFASSHRPGTDFRYGWQVLTGAPPFAGQQGPELACQVVLEGKRPHRPNGSESLGITDEIWDLLGLCWAEDVSSRPTVSYVMGCLDRAAKHWTEDATTPLLVSGAGVQEMMDIERERAQKIADELDKVRRHVNVQQYGSDL